MGQKTEYMDRIIELFYESPQEEFTVREIAKRTKVPKSTVQKYLPTLKKNGLVDPENRAHISVWFKTKKINYYIEKIIKTGLIAELIHTLNPSCIILFGSIRKGDSVQESDIDLFVESSLKKKILLAKYEKLLKHRIELFIENDIHNLSPHLFNNVVNGIKLYGSFSIK